MAEAPGAGDTPLPGGPTGPRGRGIARRAKAAWRTEEGVTCCGAGLAAGDGFLIQPEPVESALFILGRKAGPGGWGQGE